MSNANTETLYKIVKEMATISPEINPSKNPNKDIMEFERMNQTLSGDSRRVAYYMDLIESDADIPNFGFVIASLYSEIIEHMPEYCNCTLKLLRFVRDIKEGIKTNEGNEEARSFYSEIDFGRLSVYVNNSSILFEKFIAMTSAIRTYLTGYELINRSVKSLVDNLSAYYISIRKAHSIIVYLCEMKDIATGELKRKVDDAFEYFGSMQIKANE
jgi:hypothetical protein